MPESAMSPQDALVAIMVACSAADQDVRTAELVAITRMVNHMPAFATYDPDRIRRVSRTVFDLFEEEDGLDALFGLIERPCPSVSTRPPMRWPATWSPPTAATPRSSSACWKRSAKS